MDTEKKTTIDDLNRLYEEGEQCDKELFSEQRSNILLSSGDHFSKKHAGWWNRIRESKSLNQDQKIRITKNHIHRVVRTYINNITSMSPWVVPMAVDQRDLRHTKTAELNKAVWEYAKQKHGLRNKVQAWVKDFIEIGEVFAEVYFDPSAGRFVGYEQETDDQGLPMHDEMGQPVASDRPSFTGDLIFKTILPANVIRAAEAKTIAESRFLCVREMVHIKDLEKMVGDDEDKLKLIEENNDETFFVFDNAKNSYSSTKNQTMVKKFYFRSSVEYPHGYYYITTKTGILFEGELPYGVFPVLYGGFDEIATTPRHRSIIKQLRPIQSEINRAASAMAMTQITLGDDKVILQNGSKVTTGPQLPGIRTMFVTGQAPTTMPGRTGDQYLPYLESQVNELYRISNIDQDSESKQGQDAWANLYASIRDKKKFSIYGEKFEQFLIAVCQTYLELAKNYFDENMLIPAIGRSEYINIAEFKTHDPLCVRIKIEPQSDDINTMMGKTLVFNHILQYVGQSLSKDDIGKIMRAMPFANSEDAFDDFTLDNDTAENIILALDRGEPVQPQKADNAEYILKRLSARQKRADYRMLPPPVQMAYEQLMQAFEQQLAQQAMQLKQAESAFIPASGALIKCDYYVQDPTNPDRSIRATVPAEAIDWLIKQLTAQGSAQAILQQQSKDVQSGVAQMISNQGPMARQLTPPPQQPQQGPSNMAAGSPQWLAMRQALGPQQHPGGNSHGI